MSLVIPGTSAPSNLHLPAGARAMPIDGDLLNICERVKEISPALSILLLEHDDNFAWAIMETAADGTEMLVFRTTELDGRVIDKLRQLMAKPLNERMAELEKQEYKMQEEQHDAELELLYETLGRPMWTQLEHDGFIQRGVSYPKRGVKAS